MGDLSPNPAAAGLVVEYARLMLSPGYAMAYPFLVFSLMGRPTSYKPVFPPKPPGCAVRVQLTPSGE